MKKYALSLFGFALICGEANAEALSMHREHDSSTEISGGNLKAVAYALQDFSNIATDIRCFKMVLSHAGDDLFVLFVTRDIEQTTADSSTFHCEINSSSRPVQYRFSSDGQFLERVGIR